MIGADASRSSSMSNVNEDDFTADYCDACTEILTRLVDHLRKREVDEPTNTEDSINIPHHEFAPALLAAAAWGCGICARLVYMCEAQKQPMRYASAELDGDMFVNCRLTLREKGSTLGFSIGNVWASFSLTPFNKSELTSMDYDNIMWENTGFDAVLERGKRWLDTCLANHERCNKSARKDYYPPRLLSMNSDMVHLIDTGVERPSGAYAALSYCWGRNPNHMTLTANNRRILELGVPITALGKAFEEAIQALKTLGIFLVWIDALCILQAGSGSVEDWRRHVTEMSVIYSNCTVNIAIDHAENVNKGCFVFRHSAHIKPCIIDPTLWPGHIQSSSQASTSPVWLLECNNLGQDEMTSSVLFQRGWVMQERLLSPRILHFGGRQLYWECSELRACESHPCGFPPDTNWYLVPFSLNAETNDVHEHWSHLVESYSHTYLTHAKDKLPAIAGIAKRICEDRKLEYLAGHLGGSLPMSLCWRNKDVGRGLIRHHASYRAPSWSWAAWDGPIQFEDAAYDAKLCSSDAPVLDYPAPDAIYSRVGDGELKVHAVVIGASDLTDITDVGVNASACTVMKDGIKILVQACQPGQFNLYYDEGRYVRDRQGSVLIALASRHFQGSWTIVGLIVVPENTGPFDRRQRLHFLEYQKLQEMGGPIPRLHLSEEVEAMLRTQKWERLGMFTIHELGFEEMELVRSCDNSTFGLI